MNEREHIQSLLANLNAQTPLAFPAPRSKINAPNVQGVYMILDESGLVVHVGRTVRGKNGLSQRLQNHVRGKSSFARGYLHGKGNKLRRGFKFKYVPEPDDRARALLEYCATAWHCPAHLGVGRTRKKDKRCDA